MYRVFQIIGLTGLMGLYDFTQSFEINPNERIQLSSPEHVGLTHTEIIQNLQQEFERKLPQNDLEYLHAISIEMRKLLCNVNDVECNSNLVRKTINIKPSNEMDLRYKLDPIVLEAIEDLLDSATITQFKNPNNVIRYMNKKMEMLKHSDSITKEEDRIIGLVAHSVGMESAKQWSEVLNDPTNPFHLIRKNHDRKLQLNLVNNIDFSDDQIQMKFVNVLQADILGSVTGAVNSVFESNKDKSMLDFAVEEASISSLKSFSDNFVTLGIGVSNEMNDECNFPNAFWCNTGSGNILPGNLNDIGASGMTSGAGCLFPGSPLCNQVEGNEDGDDYFEDIDFNENGNPNGSGNNMGNGGNNNVNTNNGNVGNGGGVLGLTGALGGGAAGQGSNENNVGSGGGLLNLAGAAAGNGGQGSNENNVGSGGGLLGLAGALAGGAAANNNGGVGNGGFGGGGFLDPCAIPDSPLCEISGNVIGTLNNQENFGISGSGGNVLNQNGSEDGWDEDDDEWIDTNTNDLDDCPYPNSPRCKSNTFTTDDGIEIHCAIPTSTLCQLARKRLKLPSTSNEMRDKNP